MTLDALIGETLGRNPGLRASWAEFEAALQRIPQVTSLSDPMLTATVFLEEVQTRTGPQEFALRVQQRFPWFGALDLRGQVAFERAQEKLQVHLTEILDLTRRVQGLWWELAHQITRREIAEEELQLLENFADVAASLYGTGRGSQQAVLRAEVEITRVDEELIGIQERVDTLTSEANVLRDRDLREPLEVPSLSAISIRMVQADTASLIASAEGLRPELAGLRHRIERHERERRLARTEFFPEFMVGANWIAVGSRPDHPAMAPPDEGDDAVNLVFGATIPIWWRAYRAAVAETERNIDAAESRLLDTRNRVAHEVLAAHFAMTEALDLMELYATALIPQADQTMEATEAAFAAGQASSLDVIDTVRVLLRLRLAHERARRDHTLAAADLERAVGAALVAPAQAPPEVN